MEVLLYLGIIPKIDGCDCMHANGYNYIPESMCNRYAAVNIRIVGHNKLYLT